MQKPRIDIAETIILGLDAGEETGVAAEAESTSDDRARAVGTDQIAAGQVEAAEVDEFAPALRTREPMSEVEPTPPRSASPASQSNSAPVRVVKKK